jgi:hypothetical protein
VLSAPDASYRLCSALAFPCLLLAGNNGGVRVVAVSLPGCRGAGVVIGLCASSALYFFLDVRKRRGRSCRRAGSVAFFDQPGAPEMLARIADAIRDAYFFYPYYPCYHS